MKINILNNKIIYVLIAFLSISLINRSMVKAADFNVVCDNSGCNGLSGPVFNEGNILPGDSADRTISIVNNKNEELGVTMRIGVGDSYDVAFTDEIVADLVVDSVSLYNAGMTGLLNKNYDLGDLPVSEEMDIKLGLLLPAELGNEYQGRSIEFDLVLIFTGQDSGEEEVLSTSTSSEHTNDNSNNTEGEVLGTSTESKLGQLLGLSDTKSEKYTIQLKILGMAWIFIGFTMLLNSLFERDIRKG